MSIDITVETRIAKPLGEVAAYVIDPANEPKWIKGIRESVPLMPGPIGKGSRVRRVAHFMGRRIEYTPEVLEFEAGRRLLMRTTSPFPMTIEYSFTEERGEAVFRQRLQGGPKGIAAWFSPLMAAMVRRNVGADMARLRALLEQPR